VLQFWSQMVIYPYFFNFVILPYYSQTKIDFTPILLSPHNGVNFWIKWELYPYTFTPVLFWYLYFYLYFRSTIWQFWYRIIQINKCRIEQLYEKFDIISTYNPYNIDINITQQINITHKALISSTNDFFQDECAQVFNYVV